jgi:hypothetical protein
MALARSDGRALERNQALARISADARPPAAEAEARLRSVLEEVTALDLEIERRSAALADFSRAWDRALGAAFAELAAAEKLVRRLQGLEDALLGLAARIKAGEPPPRRRRPRRGAAAPAEPDGEPDPSPGDLPGAGEPDPDPSPEIEAEEVVLKRLYRRLARVLHPDLARDDAERSRLSELMARVNAAYARGDRTELEVTAERVGAGEPPGELSEEERVAHLESRIATLTRIAASLERERDRLLRSDTERLRAEAERRAGAGGDLVEETRAELSEETAAAHADGLARLGRLEQAAREVARARKGAMREIERRGPTGARRAFDPLGESELVRRGAARLEQQRATAAARELARGLEEAARKAPWDVALTCLAFFAEEAGARPPDALGSAEGWAARWDLLRAAWPDAPALAPALARLPRHLALGARTEGDSVLAGLQLASEDLAAGVRIAIAHPAVSAIAREVLAVLGPEERCEGCGGSGPVLHLHRTRGLDTLHGRVCGSCGAVLRSYWRYGEVDGLEALAPHALRLGLVAEVTAVLAGTVIGFQMLPAEAEALTAERLQRRFADLYLVPHDVALAPASVEVIGPKGTLGPGARVAAKGRLELALAGDAGMTGAELLELLRARIERRFRP